MKAPDCPTCGERAEAVTRYIHSPAFVEPCGHFVLMSDSRTLTAHPEYGDLREQDVNPEVWGTWHLMTSHRGRATPNPPRSMVERATPADPPR